MITFVKKLTSLAEALRTGQPVRIRIKKSFVMRKSATWQSYVQQISDHICVPIIPKTAKLPKLVCLIERLYWISRLCLSEFKRFS